MARRAARWVLLSLLALAGAACSSGKDTGPCASGQVLCGGCYDPARYQTDANNCGGCGIACGAGATCSGGSCLCGPGTSPCANLVPRCRDLQNDASACGTCDVSCTVQEVGWTCQQGACGCFGDRVECGTVCTDTANDPNNCGIGQAGCAQACLSKQLCVSGQCECPPDLPTACATTCANTANDTANCGACGRTCDVEGEICSDSLCQCPPLLPDRCPAGLPASCVNKASDPQNCGACDNACLSRQTCASGTCTCPSGEAVCSGACVPCAAGAACCPSGACQTKHSNGLGQFYFDCNPLYVPGSATTQTAAQLAAAAWSATGTNTFGTFCGPFCLERDTGTQCAVWCYGSNPLAGRVGGPSTQSCALACPNALSPPWN